MKKSSISLNNNKNRIKYTFIIVVVMFMLLIVRLSYIMIFKSKEYKSIAESQWISEVKLAPKRGRILYRNGNPLAVTAEIYRVDLDLITLKQTIEKKNISISELTLKLSDALSMQSEDVNKILNRKLDNALPASSAVLKRKVEKTAADKVKALNLRGIIISSDNNRYYPNNNLLSQVIGHTNSDGNGVTGVEFAYNKELSGISGITQYETDNRGRELPFDSFYTKPVDGKDIVLTIDENIQLITEKYAEKALKDNKAKAVSITVMDPNNGEILAMTNKPDYNLNSPGILTGGSKDIQTSWKNSAVQNAFEPGSIFKAITAAAALEKGIVSENDTFICNGSLKVANTTLYCWKRDGHGVQNLEEILKNSCNVGFMELGSKLGKESLIDFAEKVGFGQKTGIDLPGESSGIVNEVNDIGPVELANISFGQGIAVTQVQYLAAFNAIANGGTWIKPHIMKEIVHYEDDKKIVDSEFQDFQRRNVFSNDTSAKLRRYLEKVVSEGVGKPAFVDGFRIGGKTGTAQKIDPNTKSYKSGKYISSFAGMAPIDDPKITILISIDEPDSSKYYAGETAAPIAKELFTDIFNYLNLKK